MSNVLMWALLRGLRGSERPWGGDAPKIIVTVPGLRPPFHPSQKNWASVSSTVLR